MLILALREYIGRFELLLNDHTIFGGVTYTDVHITLTGMLIVCFALVLGSLIAFTNAISYSKWTLADRGDCSRSGVLYRGPQGVAWYVSNFIVKPNGLVREKPYIAFNTESTRQAYGLNRVTQREFPAETTVEAADPEHNQATLQNIRLWDWHALQDTLRRFRKSARTTIFPTSISIAITLTVPLEKDARGARTERR